MIPEQRYGDKWEVGTWVRQLDQKQQRSAMEDGEGDLPGGGVCRSEEEGV